MNPPTHPETWTSRAQSQRQTTGPQITAREAEIPAAANFYPAGPPYGMLSPMEVDPEILVNIQHRLAVLAERRRTVGLTHVDQQRYEALCQLELELLDLSRQERFFQG